MSPDRVTVKVNVVLSVSPSFWLAFVAAIASVVSAPVAIVTV